MNEFELCITILLSVFVLSVITHYTIKQKRKIEKLIKWKKKYTRF